MKLRSLQLSCTTEGLETKKERSSFASKAMKTSVYSTSLARPFLETHQPIREQSSTCPFCLSKQ